MTIEREGMKRMMYFQVALLLLMVVGSGYAQGQPIGYYNDSTIAFDSLSRVIMETQFDATGKAERQVFYEYGPHRLQKMYQVLTGTTDRVWIITFHWNEEGFLAEKVLYREENTDPVRRCAFAYNDKHQTTHKKVFDQQGTLIELHTWQYVEDKLYQECNEFFALGEPALDTLPDDWW